MGHAVLKMPTLLQPSIKQSLPVNLTSADAGLMLEHNLCMFIIEAGF